LVPVTVAGTRATPFSFDWVTEDVDAIAGVDYVASSGTLSWTGTAQGTKWVEVPLLQSNPRSGARSFRVKMVLSKSVTCAPSEAVVTVFDNALEDGYGEATSANFRLEARGSFGGVLANGVEKVGTPSGGNATAWDTTLEPDGWQTLLSSPDSMAVCVINDASVAVEGGRMVSGAVWTFDQIHVVRNWVVVPSGVTLVIEAGAIVKFTEGTGILVEPGGACITHGVVFTHIADDTAGGDTNMDGNATPPVWGDYTLAGVTLDETTLLRYYPGFDNGTEEVDYGLFISAITVLPGGGVKLSWPAAQAGKIVEMMEAETGGAFAGGHDYVIRFTDDLTAAPGTWGSVVENNLQSGQEGADFIRNVEPGLDGVILPAGMLNSGRMFFMLQARFYKLPE